MSDTRVSVLVRVEDLADLRSTMAGLDGQTAPTDQWQVVLVTADGEAHRRAAAYQQFRPNVTAVGPDEDPAAAVAGGWVWEVAAGDTFPRTAIARVTKAIGAGSGVPIVGRTVSRERLENDWLFDRSRQVTGGLALLALGQAAVVLPRALWSPAGPDAGGYGRFATAVATLAVGDTVELLAGGAVLVGQGPQGAAPDAVRLRALVRALEGVEPAVAADTVRAEVARQSWAIDAECGAGVRALAARVPEQTLPLRLVADGRFEEARALRAATSQIGWEVASVDAGWEAGSLRISGSATLQLPPSMAGLLDGAGIGDLGEPRPRLGLRNRATTSTVPLPTTVEVEALPTGWRTTFHSDLKVDGWVGALPNAAYQIVLEAPGLVGNPLTALQREDLHLPGIVRDRLVTLRHEAKGGLHLDVGAARQSLLRDLDPGGAQIEESLRGAALSVPTPPIHVWPQDQALEQLPGELLLGGLAFPAVLTLEPLTVHCLVSGLPGSVAIQSRFGTGKATQTGCELRVSPDGRYTVGPLTTAETSGISRLVASGTSPNRGPGKPVATVRDTKRVDAQGSTTGAGEPGLLRAAWRRLPTPVRDRLRGPVKRLIGH